MSGPTPCWSTKQICIKIHVPSLSCPSTGVYIYIYIYIYICVYIYIYFGPCKVIQESLGFWIPRCGFRIPCPWILGSTSEDFRFHGPKLAGF